MIYLFSQALGPFSRASAFHVPFSQAKRFFIFFFSSLAKVNIQPQTSNLFMIFRLKLANDELVELVFITFASC